MMQIDSDKLLELVDEHEDSTCRIDTRIIRDAIHSGELAAKRVYARAPIDVDSRGWVKPGGEYPVSDDDGHYFLIDKTGFGEAFCRWRTCGHLDGGNWERVEK